MSDLFHEDVPADFICRVWRVMKETPRHTYQILTKRPDRMAELLSRAPFEILSNVWPIESFVGATAFRQKIVVLVSSRAAPTQDGAFEPIHIHASFISTKIAPGSSSLTGDGLVRAPRLPARNWTRPPQFNPSAAFQACKVRYERQANSNPSAFAHLRK
jgi:hypothetical protein